MKILASTPQKYGRTVYIAELNADELKSLLLLGSYSKITCSDKDGAIVERDGDEMKSGDVIEPTTLTDTAEDIRRIRSQRGEIIKSFAVLKGAMTKIQNTLPGMDQDA